MGVHPFSYDVRTLICSSVSLFVVVAFTCWCGFLCTLGFLCIHAASFPPTILLPGAALPCSHRSGFLRSRFPCLRYYDCATTAQCPSRSLFALYLRYWRLAPVSCCIASLMRSLFPPRAGKSPVYLFPASSVGGLLSPEILSPHTFPYDLLYICPAL